ILNFTRPTRTHRGRRKDMSRFTDPTYLRDEQYRTPSNLTSRADLHRRFSTAPGAWTTWVMDHLSLQARERVLEAGGGPGWLWRGNRTRLPTGVRVCFTDFSPGMVWAARHGLPDDNAFTFANADVQHLPLRAGAFDLAIANQMLYHVPDLPRAVQELARVLRPAGRLCAATNGAQHMHEFYALVHEFDTRYPAPDQIVRTIKYRLEDAIEWLSPTFARVEVRRRPDALWVTEAGALVDYALSTSVGAELAGSGWADGLGAFFQSRLDRSGGIAITKDMGVVLAWQS